MPSLALAPKSCRLWGSCSVFPSLWLRNSCLPLTWSMAAPLPSLNECWKVIVVGKRRGWGRVFTRAGVGVCPCGVAAGG